MSLSTAVRAYSLRLTEYLVEYGHDHGPGGNVIGATNTTPIELTIDGATQLPVGAEVHCIVADVGGCAAANGTRVAIVTGVGLASTTFTLWERDDGAAGGISAVSGNGAYTSGGTMASGLTDGRVLLGPEHVAEGSAPPRLVVVPRSSTVEQLSPAIGYGPTADFASTLRAPPRFADRLEVECHLWAAHYGEDGIASDPIADYDALEVLRGCWLYAVADLSNGMAIPSGSGAWGESEDGAAKIDIVGRRLALPLTITIPSRPVPADMLVLPAGWTMQARVVLAPSDPDGNQAVPVEAP